MAIVPCKIFVCQFCRSRFSTLEDAQACAIAHVYQDSEAYCSICHRKDPPARCCDLKAMQDYIEELECEYMQATNFHKVAMLKSMIEREKAYLKLSKAAIKASKTKEKNNGSN
jgi:hypothetical protein